MVRIVPIRIKDQEETIKNNGIRKENIISVTPVLDDSGTLVVVFVIDDGN